jgi:polyhydroxyalkanoate synthesis regulator protein
MQGMMAAYMDQSKNVFMQMQDQLQNQTKNIFAGFPFPGFPGQPVPQKKDEGEKS